MTLDSSTQIVEAIWPLASVFHRQELGHKAVLPLRTFIQETLRRSRTSYSTLQVALYYLILVKPHVPSHDFTMEQPDDIHAVRALQCGRRMFLAALILASKYLQDRNYSARAWSKISGLATQEINQNEMAFLSAVNWKLHITDAVFKRWTEIILKHIPSQPPSSGSACFKVSEQRCLEWKNLIQQLDPGLGNIEDLLPINPSARRVPSSLLESPSSSPSTPQVRASPPIEVFDATPTPKNIATPTVMEPALAGATTPGRLAPALGLLPTPRLTPQLSGFCTPAVTTATSLLGGRCSMSFAMAQAAQVSACQNLDRWPGSISTSPRSHMLARRPSLANSISTASSPESMVSDSSRTSRSSSISSASSLASAPSVKLDVQARCRNAKLYGERYIMKPAIAPVPEDYEENCITSSPESYTGTVGKDLYQMSLDTPLVRRDCDMEDAADAARALQELHNYHHSNTQVGLSNRLGLKRSRRVSTDDSLQENVRGMLSGRYDLYNENEWHDGMVDNRSAANLDARQTPIRTSNDGCRKRLCCSTEDTIHPYVIPTIHPAVGGPGGPGMWEGILN
ncbi:putative G1 S-specific cyclin Pcl5 [Rosellinia necatrix]|uniref:Putative G1 S-specific cyclin Pcl5 n=1 Tax=Rosellinia necatrix TaxID=77044 RepID=A0A1W2TGK8_ROSNE|nr:putative G1 S-specific cyclin Pcl5 [Rosellinia necatrix]